MSHHFFNRSKLVNMILWEDVFDKYYMLLVDIKDFNALIDNKAFFDQPIKHKKEAYEKLVEMSGNNDFTTGNILD